MFDDNILYRFKEVSLETHTVLINVLKKHENWNFFACRPFYVNQLNWPQNNMNDFAQQKSNTRHYLIHQNEPA